MYPSDGPSDTAGANESRRSLAIGDRVRLFGGYDFEPAWLGDRHEIFGTVERFIPGQNETPAVVVRLDAVINVDAARGQVVVLELGHAGTDWATPAPRIHIELCDFEPASARWQDRPQGVWVESHASYEIAT